VVCKVLAIRGAQSTGWGVKSGKFKMASCEPSHSSAYSEDLQWRIVWQTEALSMTYDKVAQNLGIDKSTVSRIGQIPHNWQSQEKHLSHAKTRLTGSFHPLRRC
jgi:DNA invertase Pin-like site-specific DNA recombinase